MTKVVLHYQLNRPLDDVLLDRIATAHSIFGLLRVQMSSDKDITVEYDAARLTTAQVESALHRAGIPVQAKA